MAVGMAVGVGIGVGVGSGWKRPHATDAKTGIPSNRSPSSPALFRLTIPSSHFEMRRVVAARALTQSTQRPSQSCFTTNRNRTFQVRTLPTFTDSGQVVRYRCSGPLVFHHQASDGNGLVYRHTAPDHRLEGPWPAR